MVVRRVCLEIALKKGGSGLAVGFLERALKLDPQNYWVHYSAKAYRRGEAAQHFEISKSLREAQTPNMSQIFSYRMKTCARTRHSEIPYWSTYDRETAAPCDVNI